MNLLPCPFCGSPAVLDHIHSAGEERLIVTCTGDGCWAEIQGFVDEGRPVENVVAAWNKRVER